jgi:hypothetical protein
LRLRQRIERQRALDASEARAQSKSIDATQCEAEDEHEMQIITEGIERQFNDLVADYCTAMGVELAVCELDDDDTKEKNACKEKMSAK